jgi:membrane protein DedA with SNARE-associated domain
VLASVTGQLTSAIGNHGVYAVFFLMAIDAVFPAASEVVMLYAGALASGAFAGEQVVLFGKVIPSGFWAFVVMVLAGTLGYTLGAVGGWAIGDYGGRPYLERHGRWLHLSPPQLEKAERWFDRWDDKAVFLGRIVPIARSFISIPAGVFRMPLRPYTWLTLAGSTIWCLVFAGAGYALGDNYEKFDKALRYVDYLIVVAVVALVAVWLVRRRRRGARNNGG